jgi:uncharacterized protein
MLDLICWVVTEGFAGMENQCVGLAEAVGLRCEIKRVRRPQMLLEYLPPSLWPDPLKGASEGSFASPWPDVLISSGRGSVAAALAIRHASGGKTFTVHIQAPYVAPSRFDLVVVPHHDSLRGDNILVTRTSLHRVTKEKLEEAARRFNACLSHLPRPLIAVLVGGSNRHQKYSPEIVHRMANQLIDAAHECGGSLAVTTSRRTETESAKILRERLKAVPLFFWDGMDQMEENPYLGILATADVVVVTSDSRSMISEACATGKPVHVFDVGERNKKFRRFHRALMDDGITRPFSGRIEWWAYDPPNETEKVAASVRNRLEENIITDR